MLPFLEHTDGSLTQTASCQAFVSTLCSGLCGAFTPPGCEERLSARVVQPGSCAWLHQGNEVEHVMLKERRKKIGMSSLRCPQKEHLLCCAASIYIQEDAA